MSLYLDTAVLVAALTNEGATARIQAWLGSQDAAALSTSLWVKAEFSSALAIKQRTGQIDADERAIATGAFAQLAAQTLTLLPISEMHFHSAARFVALSAHSLRAPDALHLAICSGYGEALCTLDRRIAEAGTALGVKTMLV